MNYREEQNKLLPFIETSAGDNIRTVTEKCYGEITSEGMELLMNINTRYDWDRMEVGEKIYYTTIKSEQSTESFI